MTQAQLTLPFSSRVYLTVPYDERVEAKKYGAAFDSVLELWWVPRSSIADFPGIYRWITNNPRLRAEAEAAYRFRKKYNVEKLGQTPRGKQGKSSTGASRTAKRRTH